ncbi:MAG: S9 family peptidase [Gemmatimonadetes bacterium]|nr:S9 family peptidase [Gemmatimonadota bacterium]
MTSLRVAARFRLTGGIPVVAAACVLMPPSASGQARFSLEEVLSAPFPGSLVGDLTGTRLAWVQNDEGVRNIWVAASPDYRGRPVTAYEGDDGQDLTDLSFAGSADRLVYVRGGSPNRAGEIPNPTSTPEGAQREIWSVPFAGGEPARLAAGSSPRVSPDGATVAYLDRGIRLVPAAGGEVRLLLNGRGGEGGVTWSPDGRHIAFVSGRGDHSFVGVVDVAQGALTWLDPGIDRDSSPVWSPDGARVAFLRVPYDRDVLPYMAARYAVPWSIRVADASTGVGSEVWRAPDGRGSAFRGIGGDNLRWMESSIVFPWEGTGWMHLYAVSPDGGEHRSLTEGDYEVEAAMGDAGGRALLVTSNRGDIDRRHIWRVPLDGSPSEPVAHRDGGIEWSPVPLADGRVAFLGASGTLPAQAWVEGGGRFSTLDPAGLPSGFPKEDLVEPVAVHIPASDGMEVPAQLFLPPDLEQGERRPAVVFFHGGSRRQMLLGFHYLGYYHNAYAFNQYMAAKGYVVLSVNYRSGVGYGLEFREALDYGARGASEFRDVLAAGLYLRGRDDVDPDAIGLWGGSYGGYLTALGLARASDLFTAGVDLHGVHDWNIEFDFDNRVLPDQVDELAEVKRLAWESSPMSSVDTWESPVLFIHGDDDRNVPFRETVDLAQKLRKRGVDVEFLSFPDEVHGFLRHESWLRAYRAAAEFFDRRLRGAGGVSE